MITKDFVNIMRYKFLQSLKYCSFNLFVYSYFLNYMPRRTTVDLAHKIYGSGSGIPIIVMHGMLGSKRNWQSLAEKFATELVTKVLTVDIRNHGDSPHALPHTYPVLASDVAQLIDKLGFDKVNLIGHSMGGRTGMVLALTQGNIVHSLVVVDISPITTSPNSSGHILQLLRFMQSIKFNGMKLNEARKIAANKMKEVGLAKSEEDIYFLNTNIIVKSDNTVGWRCNVDALLTHFGDMVSFPSEVKSNQFSGKTMFIGGQQSTFIPPEDLPHIKKLFPEAELHYVQGAGHNVHYDAASTFLQMVISFFKGPK